MDALLERKMEAYLVGDAHRFAESDDLINLRRLRVSRVIKKILADPVDEDKTARRPCYYCLSDGVHTIDCPSRGGGEEKGT